VPPLEPAHIQSHGPEPVTVEAFPALQRFVVGAVLTATPFAKPHMPLTGGLVARGAAQELVEPPLEPAHIQSHGPVPVTAEAAPTLQRFVVGLVLAATPFAEPQMPLTGVTPPEATGAAQALFVPPLEPAHIQSHGPVPATAEAVPALHRFAVGAVLVALAFAEPHTPLTGVVPPELVARGAAQELVEPPLEPAHIQSHGPVPVTAEAAPTLQRFAVGAVLVAVSFAEPQEPLSACGKEFGDTGVCEPQAARKKTTLAMIGSKETRL
jgi:hypothetical protein